MNSANSPPRRPGQPKKSERRVQRPAGADGNLLVVEDSPTQALHLEQLLEERGYSVTVAGSGEEALDLLAASRPALVLTDITMPGIDGYELCRRIKADSQQGNLPVLLVTSLSDPGDVVKGLACGADDFIVKPYVAEDLLARVQFNLANRQLHTTERAEIGVEISFAGQRHFITSGRLQILNLLLSTYETAVKKNLQLEFTRGELEKLTEHLGVEVEQRTAALRASEVRYRSLAESAQDQIFTLDMDGRLTYLNSCSARALGGTPEQLTGKRLAELFPAETLATQVAMIDKVVATGLPQNATVSITFPAATVWLDTTLVPITDQAGTVTSIMGIGRDVTERLRDQERFRVAAESLSDVIYEWDLGERIDWYGDVDALMGYEPGEFPRTMMGWAATLHPEDLDRVMAAVERHLKGEAPYEIEYRVLRKNGGHALWAARGTAIRDANGAPVRWIGAVSDVTEQTRAEAALLKEKIFADSAVNSLPGIFYVFDESGHFLRWNRNFETVSGYSSAEMETLSPLDLFADEEKPLVGAAIQRSFAEGQADVEATLVAKHGGCLQFYFTGLRFIADGRPYLVGMGVDITERKRVEEELRRHRDELEQLVDERSAELRASERRYRDVAEMVSDFVFQIDVGANGELTTAWITDGFNRMTGFTVEDIRRPDDWAEIVHADDLDGLRGFMAEVVAGELAELEFRLVTRDGRQLWLNLRGRPQCTDEGVTSILGAGTDITARKAAETKVDEHRRSLEKLSAELETIIDAFPGLVFYKDAENRYVRVNRYMADAFGISKQELEGKSAYELHDHALAKALHDDDLEVIRSGVAKLGIDEAWPTGAGLRWLVTNKMPFRRVDGEIIGVIGVSMDITGRKNAEDLLLKRSLELEAANSELDAFAYSVSHDLRAPLRAIDGYSKILVDDYYNQLDDEARRILQQVRTSAQEMGVLINDLLEFSRLGRRDIGMVPLDLGEMARRVFGELEQAHPDRELQLQLGDLAPAFGDRAMIFEVLRNLLGNAVKFTAHRAPALIVVTSEDRDGETVYHVRDNGAGFDMRYVAKLFKVFQRLHHRREFEGTGIGLALVDRIVRRHGGRVWAAGEVDKGATISFSLPLGKETT